ncbi:MAG: hypothetical protein AAFQ82_20230, partial [Myxococcota bacterium]
MTRITQGSIMKAKSHTDTAIDARLREVLRNGLAAVGRWYALLFAVYLVIHAWALPDDSRWLMVALDTALIAFGLAMMRFAPRASFPHGWALSAGWLFAANICLALVLSEELLYDNALQLLLIAGGAFALR